jgi:hypothetical protein
VQAFCGDVHLGVAGNVNVTVGPIGRDAMASVCVGQRGYAMAYSYSCSRGAFVGASIDGTVTHTRSNANLAFYGRPLTAKDLLLGGYVEAPPAARTLYAALDSLMNSFGYSQLPLRTQAVQHSVDTRAAMPLDATFSVDDFAVPEKPPPDASTSVYADAAPAALPSPARPIADGVLRLPCLRLPQRAAAAAAAEPSAPSLPEIDEESPAPAAPLQSRTLPVHLTVDAASEMSDEAPISLFDND